MLSGKYSYIKWICSAIGLLIGLFGFIGGIQWYLFYGPERKYENLNWVLESTPKERMPVLMQILSKRGMLMGDNIDRRLASEFSSFGDKAVLEKLMSLPEHDFSLVLQDAAGKNMLCSLVNKDIGENSADWREWWEHNRTHTQGEIFREGFISRGIPIDPEIQKEEVLPLLKIMHEKPCLHWESIAAMRWLRDRGFNNWTLVLDNDEYIGIDGILYGLLKYGQFLGENRLQDQPGSLFPEVEPVMGSYPWPLARELREGAAAFSLVLVQKPGALIDLMTGGFDNFAWAFLKRIPGTQQLIHIGLYERFFALLFGASILVFLGVAVWVIRSTRQKSVPNKV